MTAASCPSLGGGGSGGGGGDGEAFLGCWAFPGCIHAGSPPGGAGGRGWMQSVSLGCSQEQAVWDQ